MKVQIDLQSDVIVAYGNAIDGVNVFDIPFEDYTPEKYSYTPLVAGVFNPNGFVLKPVIDEIGFVKRQNNIDKMNNYMRNLVTLGQLTQANFELFIADTLVLSQGYILKSGRLFTFIETVSRNGYNAETTGFKVRAYRGTPTDGINTRFGNYPRANDILAILNDL
jgi:hypothetical protein